MSIGFNSVMYNVQQNNMSAAQKKPAFKGLKKKHLNDSIILENDCEKEINEIKKNPYMPIEKVNNLKGGIVVDSLGLYHYGNYPQHVINETIQVGDGKVSEGDYRGFKQSPEKYIVFEHGLPVKIIERRFDHFNNSPKDYLRKTSVTNYKYDFNKHSEFAVYKEEKSTISRSVEEDKEQSFKMVPDSVIKEIGIETK